MERGLRGEVRPGQAGGDTGRLQRQGDVHHAGRPAGTAASEGGLALALAVGGEEEGGIGREKKGWERVGVRGGGGRGREGEGGRGRRKESFSVIVAVVFINVAIVFITTVILCHSHPHSS